MIKSSNILLTLCILAGLGIISSACQTEGEPQFSPPVSTSIAATPTITPTRILESPPPDYFMPDKVIAPELPDVSDVYISAPHESSQVVDVDLSAPEEASQEEPVDINLPSLQRESYASWRPPLYPVPFALTPFDHFYLTRPLAVNISNWPVEDYRYGGSFFEDVVHTGMDIKIPVGTPIQAAGPGKVVWSGYGLFAGRFDPDDPYGQAVMIRHDFGFNGSYLYTVYAHLDRVDVVQDQYVQEGQMLGLSGETGKTSGPHLHLEVRLMEGDFFFTLNPELWMVPPQGWGILAGKVMNTGGRKVEGQLVVVQTLDREVFWRANSYHRGSVNSDPYYQENLVISDLPAGRYEIMINYLSRIYRQEIEIHPGLVTYFAFRGRNGFTTEPPPIPGADFDPPLSP